MGVLFHGFRRVDAFMAGSGVSGVGGGEDGRARGLSSGFRWSRLRETPSLMREPLSLMRETPSLMRETPSLMHEVPESHE